MQPERVTRPALVTLVIQHDQRIRLTWDDPEGTGWAAITREALQAAVDTHNELIDAFHVIDDLVRRIERKTDAA